MYPTGSFERFQSDILEVYGGYGDKEYVTFGILIADLRQTDAEEYIYNYIDIFNDESGKYIDFFIPGYTKEEWYRDAKKYFSIRKQDYFFSYELFRDFILNLKNSFGIKYTYNPMLIIMSMIPGKRRTAKYIVIELDDFDTHGVRRSGSFFEEIFLFAKNKTQIEDFELGFQKTYIKGNLIDSLLNAIGNHWLIEINETHKGIKRFKIKQ